MNQNDLKFLLDSHRDKLYFACSLVGLDWEPVLGYSFESSHLRMTLGGTSFYLPYTSIQCLYEQPHPDTGDNIVLIYGPSESGRTAGG